MWTDQPAVEMMGIHKSFDGTPVLTGVDFEVRRGEVHALVGSNGAGKSTLMKILRGVCQADAGEIRVRGSAGIGMVFQEFSLVPSLTVAQNIFLAAETTRFGLLDDRRSRRRAREIFAAMGVSVDVDATVADLSTAYRQLTEIAKALATDATVLILDEPTASLAGREVDALFALAGRLRDQGVSIIYISHRMDEIYRIADRVTILRDGRRLLTEPAASLTPERLVEGIVGKEVDGSLAYRERQPGGEVLLDVVDLWAGDRLCGVSFPCEPGKSSASPGCWAAVAASWPAVCSEWTDRPAAPCGCVAARST